MGHGTVTARMARACSLLAALVLASACSSGGPASGESVGRAQNAVFTNGQFETGAAGAAPPNWTVTAYLNNGITVQTPQTRAGLNLLTTLAGHSAPKDLTFLLNSATGPMTQPDADLGLAASLRWPRFGNQCAIINQHSSTNFGTGPTGNGQNVNSLSQTMTIAAGSGPAGDVDPADGLVHVRFVVAPVLQNPAHAAAAQPYYLVQLTNVTQGNALLYSDFNLSGTTGIPWKKINANTAQEIDYTDWQLVDIASSRSKLAVGDQVTLEVIAGGCQPGGHFGQIYIDGAGATVPGLFVTGSAVTQVNAGADLSYQLNYQNGAAIAAAGVTIIFNTPPQTTFKSLNAPGLACTSPAAGAAGVVTCTVGTVAAAGAGALQVVVNVDTTATGVVTAGNYWIQGTAIEPLLGPHINTNVGCTLDSQCLTGNWCNATAKACTPTLANGVQVPTDGAHTGVTLNGLCSLPAGGLVCTSTVCDTADNQCGYLNGDGSCNAGSAAAVCRTKACSTDTKCGYPVGEGPCTVAAPAVCRSATCSTNGKCEPVGGCNVDADCTGGKWCNEGTHVCTAKLANGTLIPTDTGHAGPALAGMCTTDAAALVCASSVCDVTDNKCGFANGDGLCNAANAALVCRSSACDPDGACGYKSGDGPCDSTPSGLAVCRSGACSISLVCELAGGCAVDADCTGGDWCNETTGACLAPLSNGTAMPTDGKHMNPTLNGTCSAPASTLVCASTVCDVKDSECGYADGDGPCDATNGAKFCRSKQCSATASVCVAAGGCAVDADCVATEYCDTPSEMCLAKLPNGQSVPNVVGHTPKLDGTCTADAGTVSCASGVCDTKDNDCGYATGDGPCDASNSAVCRSGTCSTDLTCEPDGGCNVDADCATGNWCNETAHQCVPKLKNGIKVPTDARHKDPTLDGTCSDVAAALVCQSSACDSGDNACGYANGDGPCDVKSGGTVCRSGICADNGPNSGLCVACTGDAQCSGATPLCNATTNTCVQCGTSADCAEDDPICDTKSGLCTMGCKADSDCMTTQWCDAASGSSGLCQEKIPNGSPLPSQPTSVATCSAAVGTRVCVSGACDASDNLCGLAASDGPCTIDDQCRAGSCDTESKTCSGGTCTTDSDCPSSDFCSSSSSSCTPKLPTGQTCDRAAECRTNDCYHSLCSGVIAQGAGVACAVSQPGSSTGSESVLFAMMLAVGASAIGRRRKLRAASPRSV